MNIFIAGCGRSGTTLIRDLMNCFEDTFVLVEGPYGEAPASRFKTLCRSEKNIVIKRAGDSWKALTSLPEDIALIYCVRHPFDTLTSTHPATKHLKRFHITQGRWVSEYRALKALQIAQPNRQIFFLRYEDLVHNPDMIQEKIATHFGLASKYSFRENPSRIKISDTSIEKWRTNPDFSSYLQNFPSSFKFLVHEFCEYFDYTLSLGYTSDSLHKESSQYRFTVIIPLEFHRGQIEKCLKGWNDQNNFPRDQYEILAVGCNATLNNEEVSFIKSRLRPHDRVLLYDEPHDISLCAHAAHEAKGEILIFTESHCMPEPDALIQSDTILNLRPDWAGFSGGAERIITNKLSVAEADMYQGDIRFGLTEHPWRKVLDQIFIIRNEEYKNAGGFVPELGHFAEWHLAASLHQKEYLVEYNPKVKVAHYYSGEHNELLEFTKDFTYGEMKYKADFLDDPCQDYFPVSTEWLFRFNWLPHLARRALFLALKARSKSTLALLSPIEIISRLRLLLTWYIPAYFGIKPAIFWRSVRHQFALLTLHLWNFFPFGKHPLRTAFLHLIDTTIQLERIRFIQHWLEEKHNLISSTPTAATTRWDPNTHHNFISVGFHPLEEWKEMEFRWSEPVAIIELPLQPGTYRFTLEWLPIKKVNNLIFYLNEKTLSISPAGLQVSGIFTVDNTHPVRFSWSCEPWNAPGDSRLLGLPVASISWAFMDPS